MIKRIFETCLPPRFRRNSGVVLRRVIFFVPLCFLFTCSRHCCQYSGFARYLTVEESRDLENFFESLLFHNYGAYVLFGSKPLCELSVRDMDSPEAEEKLKLFLSGLSEEDREKIKRMRLTAQAGKSLVDLDREMDLESSRYRGWLALQKLMGRFNLSGFLFRVVPTPCPGAYDTLFIDIQKTALILDSVVKKF